MLVVSNSNAQTVEVGSAVVFDTVVLKTGNNGTCSHRPITSGIKIGAGLWKISYHANASSTAGAFVLGIEEDGILLPETQMIETVNAIDTIRNMSAATVIRNCGCERDTVTISVVNVGAVPVALSANSCLIIERIG